jgi:uncharacterized protein with PQ loop repeat
MPHPLIHLLSITPLIALAIFLYFKSPKTKETKWIFWAFVISLVIASIVWDFDHLMSGSFSDNFQRFMGHSEGLPIIQRSNLEFFHTVYFWLGWAIFTLIFFVWLLKYPKEKIPKKYMNFFWIWLGLSLGLLAHMIFDFWLWRFI